VRVLPVTVRDLITPRTGTAYSVPNYLPGAYTGEGTYNLALPGGSAVQVELTALVCWGLCLLWLGGMVVTLWRLSRGSKRLITRAKANGERLEQDHPFYRMVSWNGEIWLCDDIPTSFVTSVKDKTSGEAVWTVFLQRGLSPKRMELVLRHEANHKALWHCNWKIIPTAALCIHWWNPLIWLAYFATCRDMELDCDARTLKELEAAERREYAHALVELGVGRQLWDAPMCFGECDAKVRVKEVVRWRPTSMGRKTIGWCVMVLLVLCLAGGPGVREKQLPEDRALAWSGFLQDTQQLTKQVQYGIWVAERFPEDRSDRDIVQIWAREDGARKLMVYREDGIWWEQDFYFMWVDRKLTAFPDYAVEREQPDLTGYVRVY